jgi:hypothetical protein
MKKVDNEQDLVVLGVLRYFMEDTYLLIFNDHVL